MLNSGSPAPFQIFGLSAVAALLGCHRDTARKFFNTGAIKTTTIAGRRVTTLAEVQRALGVDEAGRIVAPQTDAPHTTNSAASAEGPPII